MFVCSFQPAPFFVLDEIDAALDNTNIGKVRIVLCVHFAASGTLSKNACHYINMIKAVQQMLSLG